MTDTEELIVGAMHLQADRRPDGAVVREALAGAGTRRRGRRGLIGIALAAAAVVAIAITVPLVLHREPAAPVAAATPPVPGEPAFWQQAMAYQPGWLPDDVVESERMAGSKSLLRSWRMPAGSPWPGPMVTLSIYQTNEPLRRTDDTTVIDVNGKPANVDSTGIPQGNQTEVKWQAQPNVQVWVVVDGGTKHQEIAVHIAKALRSDGTKQLRAVVDPGWCPYDDEIESVTSGPSLGGHAPEGLFSCAQLEPEIAEVQIFIDHQPALTKGTKVTARGKQALYVNEVKKGTQTLSVPVGDGRYLAVVASGANHHGIIPLTQAEVIKIADTAVVHDAAYVNWIGKR